MKKDRLEKNIWKYYFFNILTSFVFFVPVIVLFWQDNGLSMFKIMLLQSIYAIATVILEIPTGYFADVFGRKKAIIIASLAFVVGEIIYSVSFSFNQFIIAELFWAVGISMISGSDSALIYDTLVELKRENQYKKIWGHTIFLGTMSIAVANILGGIIGQYNLRATLVATIPFLALAVPIALSLEEPKRHKKIFKKGYMRDLFVIVKQSLFHDKQLRGLLLFSGVIYGLNQGVLWFYQPYFVISGIAILYFGLIFSSFQIVAAFSSKYAHIIEKKVGRKYSLLLLPIIVGMSYLFMSKVVFIFSFVFAYLQQFVRGFRKVVLEDYIHKVTSSKNRATIMSVQSLIGQLIYALLVPVVGWIADVYSILQALFMIGITTFILGGILLVLLYIDKVWYVSKNY